MTTRSPRRALRTCALGLLLATSCSTPSHGEERPAEGVNTAAKEIMMENARKLVASKNDHSPDEVRMTAVEGASIPGWTQFVAESVRIKNRPHVLAVGIVSSDGQKVVLDRDEAARLIALAWKYGPARTVPADQVALVMGTFQSRVERANPLVTPFQIRTTPKYADLVFLPREGTIDGAPAVEFWNSSPEKGPGVWFARAIFASDGKVTVTREKNP